MKAFVIFFSIIFRWPFYSRTCSGLYQNRFLKSPDYGTTLLDSTKPPPALSCRLMYKNTQQIPHSLSIEIQGQLPATLLAHGMYKQRQGNAHTRAHTMGHKQTNVHAVWVSYLLSEVHDGCCLEEAAIAAVLSASGGGLPRSLGTGAWCFLLTRLYNVIYCH